MVSHTLLLAVGNTFCTEMVLTRSFYDSTRLIVDDDGGAPANFQDARVEDVWRHDAHGGVPLPVLGAAAWAANRREPQFANSLLPLASVPLCDGGDRNKRDARYDDTRSPFQLTNSLLPCYLYTLDWAMIRRSTEVRVRCLGVPQTHPPRGWLAPLEHRNIRKGNHSPLVVECRAQRYFCILMGLIIPGVVEFEACRFRHTNGYTSR